MDHSLRVRRGRSFEGVADDYARARPGYPDRAVDSLLPAQRARVLELGAGTGKLTETLAARGHAVIATDPSGAMLRQLRAVLDVPAIEAGAERLPFRSESFDRVIAGQAFHWFDAERALPQIARVLRDGGELGLVWNTRDESIPWVRELTDLIGSEGSDFRWLYDGPLPSSELFGPLEREDFGMWQVLDLETLLALVRSRSYVATLADADRDALLDRVRELHVRHARGSDGLRLRYVTSCFRAPVNRAALPPEEPDEGDVVFRFR
ncbi:class I SAM-dependent methyltransferase [Solicola gregarius]|uniref:Methyltransferase domain-containing protein n=1 Tax=Solicola gregarius TaxID=2908642 RepID=A0AA46TDP7_9ACTN|nr:class I SAM-dependent methyltransferase [Solicola gregarius]UYM03361.1 methyltransferase domain-containing protein [Solicola gregarius]